MKFKVLPRNLRAQTNNILNKNERLATNIVAPTPSSTFDKSHRHITTFDSSKLIPIYCEEVLPGDIFNIDCNTLIRLATPAAATMENPIYDIHFYYVPNRILWENWKSLMGESKTAGFQKLIKKVPTIDYSGVTDTSIEKVKFNKNDFASYLGFPINVDLRKINVPINSLYFKAYCQVWNDYYRDQNLQNELDNTNNNKNDNNLSVLEYINKGWNTDSIYQLGKGLAPVSKLPDYFTTCLPWPQKGESLSISNLPLQNLQVDIKKNLPVKFLRHTGELLTGGIAKCPNPKSQSRYPDLDATNLRNYYSTVGMSKIMYNGLGESIRGTELPRSSGNGLENSYFMGLYSKTGDMDANIGLKPTKNKVGTYQPVDTASDSEYWQVGAYVPADIINAGDIVAREGTSGTYSVNDLRLTLALQHMLELDARGGTRYTEILLNHFGISASNARLDRAEFIGGFRDNINISNVVQSSAGVQNSPLGVLGGVSVTSGTTPRKIQYAAEEHGIIMGFVIVRPQLTYWQGLDKKYTRVERFDYYDPQLANIGEQPIWKYELFLSDSADNKNNEIFGFNEAWADYRYAKNRLSGQLLPNSQSDTGLSSLYVYTEYYSGPPTLNAAWMISNPATIGNTLMLAYDNNKTEYAGSQFLADFYFNVQVSRKMPVYSIPGLRKI